MITKGAPFCFKRFLTEPKPPQTGNKATGHPSLSWFLGKRQECLMPEIEGTYEHQTHQTRFVVLAE